MMSIHRHTALTAVALILTILLFHWFEIDLTLQDYFYNTQLQQWALDRDQQILKLIFYDGIKFVFGVSVIALAAALLLFKNHPLLQHNKQGLIIVLISCLTVPLLIASLKAVTNTPCPRDLAHYGGSSPYVTFLSSYPAGFIQTEAARCFPAAHASGGFALLSLFFLFNSKKNKILALSTGMTIGWSTGLYKMLIGDHFLSHTLVTMLLAWLLILLIAGSIRSKKLFLGEP